MEEFAKTMMDEIKKNGIHEGTIDIIMNLTKSYERLRLMEMTERMVMNNTLFKHAIECMSQNDCNELVFEALFEEEAKLIKDILFFFKNAQEES